SLRAYALYSGLLLIGVTGLILAPLFHRVMHHFHLPTNRQVAHLNAAKTLSESKIRPGPPCCASDIELGDAAKRSSVYSVNAIRLSVARLLRRSAFAICFCCSRVEEGSD